MSDNNGGSNEEVGKHLGPFLTAFVVLSLYLMLFQITSLSRSMAFAFNIPIYNVGIYFSKLFGFYDFSTTIGSGIEIIIYESVKANASGNDETATLVRKIISVVFFVLILITRSIYVLLLYRSNNKAYHFYILSCVEGIFFGFFQIPYYALASQYSASNTLSINASNLLVFLIQSLLEFIMSSNHIKMVRIHSFIVLSLTLISNGLWPYFLFGFDKRFGDNRNGEAKAKKSLKCSVSVDTHTSVALASSTSSCPSDLLYVSELTIIDKIIIELKDICSCCTNIDLSISIRTCISNLLLISSNSQIDYDLIAILHLVIVGIERSHTSQSCILLKQLVLFLEIKMNMRLALSVPEQSSVIALEETTTLSVSCTGDQEPENHINQECGKDAPGHFTNSISRFLMFHMSSLFKDFLFPAILPYALLELNKCRIINILIPIFNITGYMTTFILTEIDGTDNKIGFKKFSSWWNSIWLLLIPIIVVYLCSLLAIHSNVRFFKSIVNSQWRVILMVLLLFLSYTFLESVSYSGVANYVFVTCSKKPPLEIIYCHNISCMLFPYLIGKLSVGYNDIRIGSGYVLPNFRPVPGFNNKFCYWFCNIFKHAWEDIVNDFKFDIKKYL